MILAIDQGTTGTTCLVVDEELHVHRRGYAELPQHFPRPGWVEHDPEEIWQSVLAAAEEAGLDGVDTIAITNQRETTLLWDRVTGRPVAPAIVWQDRRTAPRCRELDADLIRERTGLVPDPYFSATKLEWLLREHGRAGLAFGTVDTWLVWKLTSGQLHVTDATNASRTMLASLRTLDWDDELLALFGVDRELLPRIVRSDEAVGEGELLGTRAEIRGIAGDQQAALFGQGCHSAGEGKATYGTGSFVLVHTGDDTSPPPPGLLKTAAADGYAFEGAVLVGGAALQWLRDGLGVLSDAAESEALARERRLHRRCGLRARAHRPRLALVGRRCARPDRGDHAGHDEGPSGAGGARGDRPPGRGRRRGTARSAFRPACRRRRYRERVLDAVPGRICSAFLSKLPPSARRPRSGRRLSRPVTVPGSPSGPCTSRVSPGMRR